jgi:hypothetical protein
MPLDLPECLQGRCDRVVYLRWLYRKARAHVNRDRERFGRENCTVASYKLKIQEAVIAGGSHDYYTGSALDWSLISKFDNALAREGRSKYLRTFGNLPTVDHEFDSEGKLLRFVICSWRVNDAKSHLTEKEFVELCEQVIAHRDKTGQKE